MNFLLDTNIILIYSRGGKIADLIEQSFELFSEGNLSAISVVTLGELNLPVRLPKSILFLLLLFAGIPYAYGCSCSPPPIDLPLGEMGLLHDSVDARTVENSLVFEGILVDTIVGQSGRAPSLGQVFEVTDVYNGPCVDTVIVWTAPYSAACGFDSRMNDYSIVVAARREDGTYYNARADCWRGVSRHTEPERFADYRRFLISIKYKLDGNYFFTHYAYFFQPGYRYKPIMPQLTYSIIGRNLNGHWRVYNRSGLLVESGRFESGKRFGQWTILKNRQNGVYDGHNSVPEYVRVE